VRPTPKENPVGFARSALRAAGSNGVEFCEANYARELRGERTDRILLGIRGAYTKTLILPIITIG
jgi:hypothetical protein